MMHPLKILICNDGSEQADKAMRMGTLIATGCQAEVTLFGIVESTGNSDAILEALKRGQTSLENRKRPTQLIVKSGDPIAEIKKQTDQTTYDLVIIGAVRKGTHGPFWMSSKVYKIIKEVTPPVLSVAGAGSSLNRILVCSGGLRYRDSAVHLIGTIAHGTHATITLFHVLPIPPAIYSTLPGIEEPVAWLLNSPSELGRNLRNEKDTLQAMGVPVEVKLGAGSVLDEIIQEARQGNYDLIVSGSAPNRSFTTYMLGDVTREIVNRVTCAALVLRGVQKNTESRGLLRWF